MTGFVTKGKDTCNYGGVTRRTRTCAVGQTVRVNDQAMRVVGVLALKGSSGFGSVEGIAGLERWYGLTVGYRWQ